MKPTLSFKSASVAGVALIAAAGTPVARHHMAGNFTPLIAEPGTKTDGIVVFTGGQGRIKHAYNLFSRGMSARFMVSGVDPSTTNPYVVRLIEKSEQPASTIFIDYQSANTIQNAINTAEWVKKENIRSLRLVTSDYHMARAHFELRRLLPHSVQLYTDATPGSPTASGLNSEETRLMCRAYETSLGVNFCYGMRRIMRTVGLN